ncbi:MAG: aminoacyl-tRNA hydrolase [Eubacterium sp.]|nr:aminoacyl-tRNA hydrolase [Eubacterium sp.]
MYLIIGLGNPGREYALTRHNIGFEAVDYIARQKNVQIARDEHKGLTGFYFENGEKVMLVKPMTYMNNSGECVADLADYYDVPLDNILVIYDDIDLDPGVIRIRKRGSAGTHNGMRSILYYLQSEGFPRIRIGIGKKPPQWDLAHYVLSKFTEEDTEVMREAVIQAARGVDIFVTEGIEAAMNALNRKKTKQKKSEEENTEA